MKEWTTERLNALPGNTLISIGAPDNDLPDLFLAEGDGLWANLDNGVTAHDAGWILRRPLPGEVIRVVSVPIDALLSDEIVRAAAGGHALGRENAVARIVLNQAVAHVTGEGS